MDKKLKVVEGKIRKILEEKKRSETVRKELGKSLEQVTAENVELLNNEPDWQKKLKTANDKLSKVTEQFKLLEEEHMKVMAERTQYRRYYDQHRTTTGIGLIMEGLRRIFKRDG